MTRSCLLGGLLGLVAAVAAADDELPYDGGPPAAEFWEERQEAYREMWHGPFTAIRADYLALGESVELFAADTTLASEGPGEAAAWIHFGPTGFTIAPLPKQGFPAVRGELVVTPMVFELQAGADEDVRIGRYLITLDHQSEAIGRVIGYDPEHLTRQYHGFPVFEISDAYRVEARVEPAEGELLTLGTTRGQEKLFARAAWLTFEIEGAECRMAAFRTLGQQEGPLFVPFTDTTTGRDSYGVGRYLRVWLDGSDRAILDFNRATNPWCAYSPYYNCVLPPEENRLAVEIRAGERAPVEHADEAEAIPGEESAPESVPSEG